MVVERGGGGEWKWKHSDSIKEIGLLFCSLWGGSKYSKNKKVGGK